ncbi:LacI family DNA-binding transcriptional regulator [Shinella zoogloeoides]|uniref:LacI family DNA-binding transcriptional regulator n=1 Tax=Shinella zoogloeoides TaxID=352475 RepID=A0A6N8TD36_SHIZO|nr:LacI family DNA-binding transcriptional regulator [Shinella zoogloeoides]MXO00521.1 LacI family DNA-binding transcriptional regulator [Shinella zoogloeoides]UEX83886.1 LacI family transcriptional regulator [Shinella zoogloeoides]
MEGVGSPLVAGKERTGGKARGIARRATLSDVAAEAGVSTAVVSYVLNGGPRNVSETTRIAVEQAMEKLNYRRNPVASALTAGRSNLVGLLVPDQSNPFFAELAGEFEREGRARGYLTMLGNTSHDASIELDYVRALADWRVRAVFVASVNEHEFVVDGCPIIYVHSAPAKSRLTAALFDDFGGGITATRHLIAHGYEDIHCLAGPSDFGPFGHRRRGWEAAMSEAGLSTKGRVHYVAASRLEAARQIRDLMMGDRCPRAIFSTSDEQALSVLRAAAEAGKSIPGDVALVGFDGIAEALQGRPRITTIALPLRRLAVEVFNAIEDCGSTDRRHEPLQGQLTIGETCGCQVA